MDIATTCTPASPLPALETPYDLPPGAPERFQQDGYYVARGLASASEVAAFRGAIVDATKKKNVERRPMEERDTYGKAFLQTMNLWEDDATVKRFVFARRFARVAAELLGVPAVRLYHDQSLMKEPGGGHTPWHQDQYYWPLDTANTITMWMPLVDVSEEMGIMEFARGSHREGYFEDLPIGDESEQKLSAYVRDRGFPVEGARSMAAGDATFHYGWTLHSAPGNRSSQMREVMTIIYFADGARVVEPDHIFRMHDLMTYMPGCAPGDLAASPKNPLLYSDRDL